MKMIGNKNKIAYEILSTNNGLIEMNVYFANHCLTVNDCFHYYAMVVNSIQKEIDDFNNESLFRLKENYQGETVENLFDVMTEQKMPIYQYIDNKLDFFSYDLSTKNADIAVIKQDNDLLFFGKIDDNAEFLTVQITVDEYVALLNELLKYIANYTE
ncbi:hypothetical protein [Faucicola boevrei]|uniref:hypothetical protein n=1 Tax=Faucicola boevrei TaxID=346665 RepID=UPI000374B7E1|nr:hypothetical protein [Moraxella boevrei]